MKNQTIYTRKGDQGTTQLIDGEILPKFSLILEVIGNLDELNASLGLLCCYCNNDDIPLSQLRLVQNTLFKIGASLSSSSPNLDLVVKSEQVEELEKWIDAYTEELPDLKNFILPGSGLTNAQAHISRTLCRKVERCLSQYASQNTIPLNLLAYINRLSDYFFTLSRYFTQINCEYEVVWKP